MPVSGFSLSCLRKQEFRHCRCRIPQAVSPTAQRMSRVGARSLPQRRAGHLRMSQVQAANAGMGAHIIERLESEASESGIVPVSLLYMRILRLHERIGCQ